MEWSFQEQRSFREFQSEINKDYLEIDFEFDNYMKLFYFSKMNKSILIICTSLNLGGSERQAVWLANQLSEKGFDVIYVSLKEPGILSNKISPNVQLRILKKYKEIECLK